MLFPALRRFPVPRLFPALLLGAGLSPLPHPAAVQTWRDIAEEAGLTVVTGTGGPDKNHIAESTGTGVAVLDYDQDGLPDLYFPNAPVWDEPAGDWRFRPGALYRNRGGGRFTEVTEAAGVGAAVYGQGAVSADFDADGLPDLQVTALGPNLLFRNRGDGTFAEIAAAAGTAGSGWSIGAVFLDADRDGFADLFVANYIETSEALIRAGERTRLWRGRVAVLDGPRGLVPQGNRFYRNRGDGTFADATASSGIGSLPARYSMGAAAFDLDDDGDQDLFVANDSGPNALLRNLGDGSFTDAGLLTGTALSADGATQGSMGAAVADADGNGLPDLVVTNFAHDPYAYYRGLAPDLFLEDAVGAGIAAPTFAPLGWGALFLDADNDGSLDIAFANGHLYPQVLEDPALGERYAQPDQLFRRTGEGYRETALGPPFRSSRGMAFLDVEGDGAAEIVVSNQDAPPTLWRIEPPPSASWIRFRLLDPVGERSGLGAEVSLSAGLRSAAASLGAGDSYASDSQRVLHFGLGQHPETPVAAAVRWADGTVETHPALLPRTTWLLRRGVPAIPLPAR